MIDDVMSLFVSVLQIELSWRPWSRFMVVFSAWIRSASLYLLFHHMGSRSRTCALSHWMSWPVLSACTAMPFVLWCVLTALLCSFSQTSSVLHVSPMYVLPQLQSTLYTTPFTFCSAGLFFTLVKMVRSVLRDWNTIFTFRSLQDFSIGLAEVSNIAGYDVV